MEENSRTEFVLKEKTKSLENSHIAILGLGGVGGYVLEMFARMNIREITVVDCDEFEKSNLNRQILATIQTIGKEKIVVAKERVESINSECKVNAKKIRISEENVAEVLNEKYDYVLDCIDDVNAKIAVIKFCKQNKLPLLCAMGTGNRYKNPNFVVEDLFKTSYDGLARKLRTELKKENFVGKVDVAYTKENAEKTTALGSVVYYPLLCAGTMVSFVTNQIISKN
ncbi:MAG: tRNA threonylcarbamoyladenosine dehydratase [Clostridia bacterium]|nr:tRNA threonylcarbamoyladenosine dehydratase [Clostridia bacterium]